MKQYFYYFKVTFSLQREIPVAAHPTGIPIDPSGHFLQCKNALSTRLIVTGMLGPCTYNMGKNACFFFPIATMIHNFKISMGGKVMCPYFLANRTLADVLRHHYECARAVQEVKFIHSISPKSRGSGIGLRECPLFTFLEMHRIVRICLVLKIRMFGRIFNVQRESLNLSTLVVCGG